MNTKDPAGEKIKHEILAYYRAICDREGEHDAYLLALDELIKAHLFIDLVVETLQIFKENTTYGNIASSNRKPSVPEFCPPADTSCDRFD